MRAGAECQGSGDSRRKFRIALVCAVRLYRDAIRAALERTDDLLLVEWDQTAAALTPGSPQPDAVILDVAGRLDRDAVRRLVLAMAPRPVIGFGMEGVDAAVDGVEAGLAGFVPAEGSVDDLAAALRAALNGRLVCSPEAARGLASRLTALALGRQAARSGGTRPQPALTGREREIAELVSEGWSNKEIARALAISPATVKNHVHIILDKLDVSCRARVALRLREGV